MRRGYPTASFSGTFGGCARWGAWRGGGLVRGGAGKRQRTGAATAQVLVVCRCEQADEGSGSGAEVVKGSQSFFFCCLGWLANDAGVGVGADAERGQGATIGCAVVGGVPAVAHGGGASGEQDGRCEFAGVHVVVVAAGDARGGAGFGPVFAAGVEPDTERPVNVGLLSEVGQDRVAAVCVDDDERRNALLGTGFGYVGDDGGQGGGTDADGAGKRGVFVGAPVGECGQPKHIVVAGDGGGDGGGDQGVGDQRQGGAGVVG